MKVVIEGCDASGKATQTKILADRLSAALFSFPDYTTPTGKVILAHLKEEWVCRRLSYGEWSKADCDPLVFQSLMTINRFEVAPRILKAVSQGRHVVFDRYYASAIVYGVCDGLDRQWIEQIQAQLPEPDLWLYLDVPPEESVRRRPERRDRYEKQAGLMSRVLEGYRTLFAEKAAFIQGKHWHIVDGTGTVAEVKERVWQLVQRTLDGTETVT